jgi:aspartate kinase
MSILVMKFGGTSVASADLVRRAAGRAIRAKQQGHDVLVVVSARGQTTDELIELAHEITDRPDPRELDQLVSTGEQISVALMAMAIHAAGYPAISFTGGQVGLITNSIHTKARIQSVDVDRIRDEFEKGAIVIVAGFQGVDAKRNVTTLGRGGSDTTAVALAAVLRAEVCEIYTDVSGVYTADPRVVPTARQIDRIAYDEMLELASLGAGVMHSRAVEFGKKYHIPIHVRSSMTEDPGTLIVEEVGTMEQITVRGAAMTKDLAKLTICGVPDHPGVAAHIFHEIAVTNVVVDDIIQNISRDGSTDVTFTVASGDLSAIVETAGKLVKELGARGILTDKNVSKVSVVGVGMRTHTGVAERMFRALADAKINIQMISTSEIKISCIIDRASAEKALCVVHDAFGLGEKND